MDKSYVGMYCCPLCGEAIGLLLNKTLKNNVPKKSVIGPELCEKCKKKLIDENSVVIYEADEKQNISGRYITVKMDNLKNLRKETKEFIEKNRFILMLEEEFDPLWNELKQEKKKEQS